MRNGRDWNSSRAFTIQGLCNYKVQLIQMKKMSSNNTKKKKKRKKKTKDFKGEIMSSFPQAHIINTKISRKQH